MTARDEGTPSRLEELAASLRAANACRRAALDEVGRLQRATTEARIALDRAEEAERLAGQELFLEIYDASVMTVDEVRAAAAADSNAGGDRAP